MWLRLRWDESRGDEFDAWGAATYYVLVDELGIVHEHIEVYDDGHVLSYDRGHLNDAYGGLADQPLDLGQYGAHEIDEATVELEARRPPFKPPTSTGQSVEFPQSRRSDGFSGRADERSGRRPGSSGPGVPVAAQTAQR